MGVASDSRARVVPGVGVCNEAGDEIGPGGRVAGGVTPLTGVGDNPIVGEGTEARGGVAVAVGTGLSVVHATTNAATVTISRTAAK